MDELERCERCGLPHISHGRSERDAICADCYASECDAASDEQRDHDLFLDTLEGK